MIIVVVVVDQVDLEHGTIEEEEAEEAEEATEEEEEEEEEEVVGSKEHYHWYEVGRDIP